MKRDMELVRELLLKLESPPIRPRAVAHLQPGGEELDLAAHDPEAVAYRCDLIREAGLIDDGGAATHARNWLSSPHLGRSRFSRYDTRSRGLGKDETGSQCRQELEFRHA